MKDPSRRLVRRSAWREGGSALRAGTMVTRHQELSLRLTLALGNITKKHVRGVPALVIEIMSPGTRHRDRRFKRDLYARAGVREYWMVDPKASGVGVFRRGETGDFPLVTTLHAAAGDTLTTSLLPGLSLALADYFR